MTTYPMPKSAFRAALLVATGLNTNPAGPAIGAELYRTYHATLHATMAGRQKKGSSGWRETEARVQKAVLKAVRRG